MGKETLAGSPAGPLLSLEGAGAQMKRIGGIARV